MRTYMPNESRFYTEEPYVKKNTFIGSEPKCGILPEYGSVKDKLPVPVVGGRDDIVRCYNKVWEIAFRNLMNPADGSGFVSDFIDTGFNGALFMWDSSFILSFAKYGRRAFDFQKTLDNFYARQHADGFICREIRESDGGDYFARHDPISTGPDIMGWCEWEYYVATGDVGRLKRVFDPLMAYHNWYRENRTWRDGTYWSSGWGCGMDNTPRLEDGYNVSFSHGHMVWVDICFQQILSAKNLVKIAEVIGRQNEVQPLRDEISNLERIVNETLWDSGTAFYYDRWKDGRLNMVMSVASYWAMLSESVPQDRIDSFAAHLDNPNEFKRVHRVPSLSASDRHFVPTGGYWCGSVWAPTTYMVLKGLEKYGKERLAHEIAVNHVENVTACFEKTGTLWENYSPDEFGTQSSHRGDFVGWTGLVPVAVLFENVIGIRSDILNNAVTWNVNLTCRHGIMNYPVGLDKTVDLICGERNSDDDMPKITKSRDDIEIYIKWKHGIFKI